MPQWRHRFSEIASKKVKTASSSAISTTSGSNAETKRLRFLNKKPLCLQYNLTAGRKALAKARRKEPSLVYAFVVGAVSLMKWILETAQREVTDFLLKPVDEPTMQEDGGVSVKGSPAIPTLNPSNAAPHLPKYGPHSSMARMAAAGHRLLLNRKIFSKNRNKSEKNESSSGMNLQINYNQITNEGEQRKTEEKTTVSEEKPTPRLSSLFTRDFGRAKRMQMNIDRHAELCYIDDQFDFYGLS